MLSGIETKSHNTTYKAGLPSRTSHDSPADFTILGIPTVPGNTMSPPIMGFSLLKQTLPPCLTFIEITCSYSSHVNLIILFFKRQSHSRLLSLSEICYPKFHGPLHPLHKIYHNYNCLTQFLAQCY